MDDDTPADGWDYSMIWRKDEPGIGGILQNQYVSVSTQELFKESRISLDLRVSHWKNGSSGCYIPTRSDNSGRPPQSSSEANRGKNLSGCDTLGFNIKATGLAQRKNLKIQLIDSRDKKTDLLNLIEFSSLSENWEHVEIPLDEFSWASGVDISSINFIAFIVDKSEPEGDFEIFFNNMVFINKGIFWRKRFKIAFENPDQNSPSWTYCGIWAGNGTKIEKWNPYNNIPLDRIEKYQGFSSLKIHVNQSPGGYAGVWFSGNQNGDGTPPSDWDDLGSPKNIMPYNTLRFFIKVYGKKPSAKFQLSDVNKNDTGKISLLKYANVTNTWQEVLIPFKNIPWKKFQKEKFMDLVFSIDDDQPAGEFTVFLDNIEFIRLPDSSFSKTNLIR